MFGSQEYKDMQKAISREAITLVKYKDKEVLPVTSGALQEDHDRPCERGRKRYVRSGQSHGMAGGTIRQNF